MGGVGGLGVIIVSNLNRCCWVGVGLGCDNNIMPTLGVWARSHWNQYYAIPSSKEYTAVEYLEH